MANENLKMNEVRPGEDLLSKELEAIVGGKDIPSGCNLYRVGYQKKNILYNACEINDEGLIKYIETYLAKE